LPGDARAGPDPEFLRTTPLVERGLAGEPAPASEQPPCIDRRRVSPGARDRGAAQAELGRALRIGVGRPRAAIVVTGSELVRGDRTDLNGPFLARELVSLGLEPARVTIVGDAPAELESALREGLQADLCVVSGGLGPTHDDRTVELLASALGVDLVVDEELQHEIGAISRSIAERLRRPYTD